MFEGRKRTVLLVEDEAIIAMNQRMVLENRGLHVLVSRNGQQAIELATSGQKIDLVLMDIDLGAGIDGTEAATRILNERDVPIVFLTSHTEQEMVRKVKGITRYGYVLKNSGEFVLIEAIQSALELFDAKQDLQREVRERRLAEEQLTRRNTFIQTILDNLPIGLAVNYIDDGRATYMNRKFESTYGWPREIIQDIPTFFERVYPDPAYREQISHQIHQDMASGDPDRMVWRGVEVTRRSGKKAIVDAMNIPIYEQNFMISTVVDVTENHAVLADLAASEARYRTLSQSLPNGIIALVDTDLRFVEVGGAELEDGPLNPDDFIGQRLRDIYPSEIADRDEPALEAALRGETSDQIVAHDGRYHRVITAPVHVNGEVRNALVLTQDITDSQLAMVKNQEMIEKLNLAIETAGLGIWSLDLETQRLTWNDRLHEIYGITRDQFDQNPDAWRAMVHPEDRARANKAFLKITEGSRLQGLHYRICRPDGEIRHILASGVPVLRTETPNTIIGINVDVTETVQREEALSHAVSQQQKLMQEASHRIKNSLMTVRALISLAENSRTESGALRDQIDAIIAVYDTLGRAETVEFVDTASLIASVITPYAKALDQQGGRFESDLQSATVKAVLAVPVALVVNELVSNAIRHGIGDRTEGFVCVTSRRVADQLQIAVENDGPRLPDDAGLSTSGSLGWKLIHSLVAQIDGHVKILRDPHTRVELEVSGVVDESPGTTTT